MSDLIPAGRYPAKSIDAQLGEAKSGNEQIGVCFQIQGDGVCSGRMLTGFFSFSDNAVDYTMEKLRNAGWQGDDLSDLSSLCPSEVECSIVVQHEDYEGKTNAKIAFVNKPDGVKMAAPLDDAKKRSLAARMKAKAIASRQGQPSAPSKPASRPSGGGYGNPSHPNAPGNGPGDDPLPF